MNSIALFKWHLLLLAASLAVIAALGFLYVYWLPRECAGVVLTNPGNTWPCRGYGLNSLSEIFPLPYWLAYVGIALSLSVMAIAAHKQRANAPIRNFPIWWRVFLSNIALWYVFLPLTFDHRDWYADTATFTLLGGLVLSLPLGILISFLAYIPIKVPGYIDGPSYVFGLGTLYLTIFHLSFVGVTYVQWYYLLPLIRRAWNKWRHA